MISTACKIFIIAMCLLTLPALVLTGGPPTTTPAAKDTSAAATSKPADAPKLNFPKIGMFWSAADIKADPLVNIARHDVIVVNIQQLGLQWKPYAHPAMVETVIPATIKKARANLLRIKKLNPQAVVLCQVYFFEERDRGYPENHLWWLRDKQGKRVPFWPGNYRMDLSNSEYVSHIVRRIAAVYKALDGRAGIFLDCLHKDKASQVAWISLLKQVRSLCGTKMLILVNTGAVTKNVAWVTPYINGLQYENAVARVEKDKAPDTEKYYALIAKLDKRLAKPHISVNEVYGKRKNTALMQREFLRTLVYTDMAYLYADSTQGHKHAWYSVWDTPLGEAVDKPAEPQVGKLARRRFKNGLVLWLPSSAKSFQVVYLKKPMFNALAKRQLEKVAAKSIALRPGTGVILVRDLQPKKPISNDLKGP